MVQELHDAYIKKRNSAKKKIIVYQVIDLQYIWVIFNIHWLKIMQSMFLLFFYVKPSTLSQPQEC